LATAEERGLLGLFYNIRDALTIRNLIKKVATDNKCCSPSCGAHIIRRSGNEKKMLSAEIKKTKVARMQPTIRLSNSTSAQPGTKKKLKAQ